MYTQVEIKPANMPAVAPVLLMRLEKIPIIKAGKMEAPAIPKASATTCAAKPGGLIPSQVATTMATVIDTRAAISSPFSLMLGLRVFLIKSCEMAEEMANSKPAAVDKAAAKPPAAIRPITQLGRLAISGLASTKMSLLTVSSLPCQPRSVAVAAKVCDLSL